ncbi:MAG: TraM recognition domain-containing protein, partial [Candidatus Ryanbacteria bacterium]|nr:TraM recognition domain-containing protein [Candidatus Ryanbacteria bacterium]
VVRSFWVQEYESYNDRFRSEAIAPIQNKVGQFLSTSMIRNIVGQPKSSLNVYKLMNEGKILLVNVAKGRVGEDNAALLGAMIITKIQLAAMERVRILESERKDFYLYVDEFQSFATDSFAHILSEARKYRLNIIIAHQYIGQLVTDTTTKVRDAVFGNVGTMIVFRVGAADAEYLENEFSPEFVIQDLVNLPNFHIYLKLMVNGLTSRPFSAVTLPALELHKPEESTSQKIIELSRKSYSRSQKEVEDEISRWSGVLGDEEAGALPAEKDKGEKYDAICSICGKAAQVSFKPDGKRPVYCSSCFKKVQSGEIPPASGLALARASYGASLGDLGIEFTAEKKKGLAPEAKRPLAPPPVRVGTPVVKQAPSKTISLKDLKPVQSRRGPDIEGLKKALKDALLVENQKNQGSNENNSKNVEALKPGQSIKL